MSSELHHDLELYRVIDANLNRLKEGIRVVEDIIRYRYNNQEISLKLKLIRHKINIQETENLLKSRDVNNDVLASTIESEFYRINISSIIIANFKRAQESSRVLEEIYKLHSEKDSENFKQIRYELYSLEKEIVLTYYRN
ncbi:MAG: thiamine-phosphate pyrophosphorylase [Sulfurimonas sp.]|nr:thiamine-phosphate pyrophosphorylase [Sulfurimonas sp.]